MSFTRFLAVAVLLACVASSVAGACSSGTSESSGQGGEGPRITGAGGFGSGGLLDSCGDDVCGAEFGEDCETCTSDCGDCAPGCFDDTCDSASETCTNCPSDCGACASACGDRVCDEA